MSEELGSVEGSGVAALPSSPSLDAGSATPSDIDYARASLAIRLRNAAGNPHISTGAVEVAAIAARLAREGWMPGGAL